MSLQDVIHLLWAQTWWTWDRPAREPFLWSDYACHYFNLVEALAWFTFAGLVLRRWLRHQHSRLELFYCVAFLTFGISDVIEAWQLTSWLLWWKATNLVVLLVLRSLIRGRYYPDQRLF